MLLRLFVAAALGGAIGVERELRERQAGLRTHLVVSVGAALFTLVSAYGFSNFDGKVDPTRIAAQIVSGIGFLGAGAIIRQGLSVRGLTTAASLWLVAAIGMAAGAGYWDGALIATLGALLTLGPLRVVAFRILSRYRPVHDRLLVEIPAGGSPVPIIEAIERQGCRVVVARRSRRRETAGRSPSTSSSRPAPPRRSSRASPRSTASSRCGGPTGSWPLCSRNRHKARELERLLPGWTLEPLERDDYPPETGETYYENAAIKAAFGREHERGWVLAEDSGLEVAALEGRPGVALRALRAGGPACGREAPRRARRGGGSPRALPLRARPRGSGWERAPRHRRPRGAHRLRALGSEGFGYDPIFVPEGEERTVAELGNEWKAQHSHRARAARALLDELGRRGLPGPGQRH